MKEKLPVADLPLGVVMHLARTATQKAARDAVASGRVVTGWKNSGLVSFGPGALPLSPIPSDQDTAPES